MVEYDSLIKKKQLPKVQSVNQWIQILILSLSLSLSLS